MDQTVVQRATSILDGLEHPSWPGRTIPAALDGHQPPTWCVHCAWLAAEIRKAYARNDWSRVADHARTALRHWYATHEPDAVTTLQTPHNGGAR